MPRVTLKVVKSPEPGLLLGGKRVDTSEVAGALAALTDGAEVDAECTYDGQLHVLAILGAPKKLEVDPVHAIETALERGYLAQALEQLAELGARVEREPALLALQVEAEARANRGEAALADFLRLLQLDAPPNRLHRAYEQLAPEQRNRAEPDWLSWVAERTELPSFLVSSYLKHVPLSRWPDSMLGRQLHATLDGGAATTEFLDQARALQAELSRRGRIDLEARRRVGVLEAKLQGQQSARAEAKRNRRPDFAKIEAEFGVALPAGLREAWSASYDGAHAGRRFLDLRDGPAELVAIARFIMREHFFSDEELARTPPPILPFAGASEEDDYLVLDLRAGDGKDFPVLAAYHDSGEELVPVAPSSAEWLRAR